MNKRKLKKLKAMKQAILEQNEDLKVMEILKKLMKSNKPISSKFKDITFPSEEKVYKK